MSDKPTGARPIQVKGVTFRCYNTGILRYEWRSDDGRLIVRSRHNHAGYAAVVDGKYIFSGERTKRFMTQENAMRAAIAVSAGQSGAQTENKT